MIRPLLLAVALAVLAAAPAAAQTPIDLGAGADPSIAVDATGTAHVVYAAAGGDVYCRLPRGARACDIRTFLPLEGATGRPAIIDHPNGTLLIVRSTSQTSPDGTLRGISYYRVSFGRGLGWSEPAPFASGNYDFERVVLAPGGESVLTLDDSLSEAKLQSAAFAGGETRTIDLATFLGSSTSADIAALPDGRVLSVFSDLSNARWGLFGGGDIYDPNAWAARGTVRNVADAELVTGPRGVFLLEHRTTSDQRLSPFKASYNFRSFDTRRARWRSGRSAGEDRFILGASSAIQDARGRLHVAGNTGVSPACVVYSRTGPRSSSWFGKSTVLFRTNASARYPERVRLGAAPDGRGYAVWQDQTNVWATPLRQAQGKYKPLRRTPSRPMCNR